MNIALMAHEKKKELMVEFCIAYAGILAKHDICATSSTGNIIADATGLKINRFLSGLHGGEEQVAARISYDEIDVVLFFRDPNSNKNELEEMNILRLCDAHNVPVATNIATAEVIIMALDRGDLDWRKNN